MNANCDRKSEVKTTVILRYVGGGVVRAFPACCAKKFAGICNMDCFHRLRLLSHPPLVAYIK